MTNTSSLAVSPIPVLFYGDTLYLIEKDGVPMTPLKPIVENIGLAWQSQHEKISSGLLRWGYHDIVIPSHVGPQEMLCIPVRKLPSFLLSISPAKVPEKKREKLIKYQEECDDALWNYWTKGIAANSRVMACEEIEKLAQIRTEQIRYQYHEYSKAIEKKVMMLERLLHASNPLYHDIFRFRIMGLSYAEIARLISKTEEFVKKTLNTRCPHVHNQRWNAHGPLGRHQHLALENE